MCYTMFRIRHRGTFPWHTRRKGALGVVYDGRGQRVELRPTGPFVPDNVRLTAFACILLCHHASELLAPDVTRYRAFVVVMFVQHCRFSLAPSYGGIATPPFLFLHSRNFQISVAAAAILVRHLFCRRQSDYGHFLPWMMHLSFTP